MIKLGAHIASFKSMIIAISIFSLSSIAYAQEQWEKDGEIEDVEIEILRERQITLPRVSRNFEKIPPRPVEPIKPEITYTFQNLKFSSPNYNAPTRPLRLKQETISKLYGNYVAAGLGNFASPYLEGWFNSKRDKNKFYGAHLYHRSFGNGPVDKKNSASANTELKIFGEGFNDDIAVGGFVNYENRGGRFYGYAPGLEVNRDTIKQTYDIVSLGASISNSKPSEFNFKLGGNFSYLKDHFEATESDLSLQFKSDFAVNDERVIGLTASYNLISQKDSLVNATARHLFKVSPSFQFVPIEKLSLSVGFNLVFENDTIRSNSVHLYPNIKADFDLSKNVTAFALLTGDIEKVSLHSLSAENFWLNSNLGIFHTNKTLEFEAGLKGKLGRRLAFGTGISATNFKDLYFYQSSLLDRAKFDLTYEYGNTQRISLYGDLNFNKDDKVILGLRGDYFGYATDNVQEAWHRPTYRINSSANFNVYKKVLLRVGLGVQGGMKAFNNESLQVVNLKEAVDLSVKANYFVSKQVSVFLKGENLLSSKYPLFLNYPVRGLQVMGGVTWSF